MKKFIIICFVSLFAGSLLQADLTSNIPFDPDVIGPPYSDSTYMYLSDYFDVINLGVSDNFTLTVDYESTPVPPNWQLLWCHELHGSGGCHVVPPEGYPPIPWNFTFNSGDTLKLDFEVIVNSSGSLAFSFTFEAASLTEPYVLNFSYTTSASIDDPGYNDIIQHNAPNPFSESTTISFDLKNNSSLHNEVAIYDIKGRLVKDFILNPGQTSISWDGKDAFGNVMPSGVYYYTIIYDAGVSQPKKLLLLR
ncbi:MAG TPA: T9SS type A sorting domain-containing protein [Candidatus Cloacimonetes bacterium]|nr:T9SS type A sorting domain-containing protein [Candidatus Cloacimonadota bacterium]HEX37325.1 T9SS type A sorting domain-containing protein [Candidatus Cloacimonadota bacterium]